MTKTRQAVKKAVKEPMSKRRTIYVTEGAENILKSNKEVTVVAQINDIMERIVDGRIDLSEYQTPSLSYPANVDYDAYLEARKIAMEEHGLSQRMFNRLVSDIIVKESKSKSKK